MNERDQKAALERLKTNRNPVEIARTLGVKASDVRLLMRNTELPEVSGWGREELQPYIVSRKRAAQAWPEKDYALLKEIRHKHDQGELTMCQGRDGVFILQYAIPEKVRVRRTPYFYGD